MQSTTPECKDGAQSNAVIYFPLFYFIFLSFSFVIAGKIVNNARNVSSWILGE